MEKIKLIFGRISRGKPPRDGENDDIVTVESGSEGIDITQVPTKTEKLNRCIAADVVFCCFVTFLWIVAFSFFARFNIGNQSDATTLQIYLNLSSFMVILIVTICNIHFETMFIKMFKRFTPKVVVVVKKNPTRRVCIVRMRMAGDKEFIEGELDGSKLMYNDVLELCCKEMNLEKDKVSHLWKVPETRIRNDDDVRRFRRIEYIEVHSIDYISFK